MATFTTSNVKGLYTYQQIDNKYVLSVTNQVELVEAIRCFCIEQNIQAGIVYGLGAVSYATLRFYDPMTKKYVDQTYNEQMEISNLTGNISTLKEEIYVHLHITLGRADYSALAGHLLKAKLSGAGEFVVEKWNHNVRRYKDEETGLNLYDLPSTQG